MLGLLPRLQGGADEAGRRLGGDAGPGLGGSRKGDLGQVAVADQGGAGFLAETGNNIHDAVGEPGLGGEFGDPEDGPGGVFARV